MLKMVQVKFEFPVAWLLLQIIRQFIGLQLGEPSTWKDQRPFTLILLLDESSEALVTGIVKELTESAVL
jgi:hypothetical protein